ncbi:MAG: hypothetical protein QHH80_10475 [Anaerolineae bacterium]|nr:hypothetical protein [Anaerolineae bacterium]
MARLLIRVIALASAALLLSGCGGPLRSPRACSDWSRGVAVGATSFNAPVALYTEPDGRATHLAWGEVSPQGDGIRYVQLDAHARVVHDRILPIAAHSPRHVRLLSNGAGGLMLLWLDGIGEARRVLAARLDPSGEPLGAPVVASAAAPEADGFAATATAGGTDVFWSHESAGEARGIYHVRLDAAGQPIAPSTRLVPGGISPFAATGDDGRVHLAWIYEPKSGEEHVFYARFDPATRELDPPCEVGTFVGGTKVRAYGPEIALTHSHAYVFWAWERLVSPIYLLSAPEAGEGECHYTALPLGEGGAPPVEQVLHLPILARPAYTPAAGDYAYTELAQHVRDATQLVQVYGPLPGIRTTMPGASMPPRYTQWVDVNSMAVYMPAPAAGTRGEVALGVTFLTATKRAQHLVIGVAYLAEGALKGYQIAGRSRNEAIRPTLAADERGHLHLAWLEPGGVRRYVVYYASTAPETRAALGRLTLRDVGDALMQGLWQVVQAVSLFPMAFLSLLLPLVWIVAYMVATAEASLRFRGPRIALAVAVLLYLPTKFFLLPPDMLSFPPFWDRLSPGAANALTIGLPLVILCAALGVMALYVRRAESRSLLAAYLIFGVTDAFLTVALYAPGFLE